MNEFLDQDINEILDVQKAEDRKQRVLSRLLEDIHDQKDHHFVLQVNMGEVTSYLTSVTLEWVNNRVGYAENLPLFQKREIDNEPGQKFQSSETMELVQQRSPDWTRRLEMSAYLAVRRNHKFPPLLLVGYQPWIYEKQNERWGTDGRAMNDSLNLTGLEPNGTYWNLDDAGTQFYALDGQHRLMAFQGLRELIIKGQLPALDKNNKPKTTGGLSREEIITYIHDETGEAKDEIHNRLQNLMIEERIGIEIIPAVRQGENFTDALRRLRQMFVDVNENAKPLTKGQLAQLDEANGYRIIARRLCQEHELFQATNTNGEIRPKVDLERPQLTDSSDCYTALHTLAETTKRYLKENKNLQNSNSYASWDNLIAKGVRVRPGHSMLDQGTQAMLEYFGHLKKIPSHTAFIQGKPASEFRKSDGEDNILFRPIVQTALAEALGKLAARGVSLENAVEKLERKENSGQLKLTDRTTPWFGVACNIDGKMRRDKKSEDLCCRMFQYLLGGGIPDDDEREQLREDFATARQPDQAEEKAINLAGALVDKGKVQLPDPWQ